MNRTRDSANPPPPPEALHASLARCRYQPPQGGGERKRQIDRGRSLRKNATECERILWSMLRDAKQAGLHFRRQVPIGKYFADFACHQAKLIVELDGEQHGLPDTVAYDAARTEFLRLRGYTVLRFGNHEIRSDLHRVLDDIIRVAQTPPTRRG